MGNNISSFGCLTVSCLLVPIKKSKLQHTCCFFLPYSQIFWMDMLQKSMEATSQLGSYFDVLVQTFLLFQVMFLVFVQQRILLCLDSFAHNIGFFAVHS